MGGKKGLSGVKDTLFGKKDPGTKDRYTPLEQEQQDALAEYNKLLKTDTNALAKNSIVAQENAIRANAADAERQAQGLVAQRGLGRSSVGLNAILNSTRDMGDRIGQVRGQLPTLAHELKVNNLNTATRGIQDIYGSRAFIQGQKSTGRGGGLVGLAATGAGAYFGGAGGAQAGASMGKGIANFGR
jgi:hypothetical protein